MTSVEYTHSIVDCTDWDRCPVCLSVTLVYCGQTDGWIKMPLGTKVDRGQGDIVLHGDPASRKECDTASSSFRPISTVVIWSHITVTAELLLHHCMTFAICIWAAKCTFCFANIYLYLCCSLFKLRLLTRLLNINSLLQYSAETDSLTHFKQFCSRNGSVDEEAVAL